MSTTNIFNDDFFNRSDLASKHLDSVRGKVDLVLTDPPFGMEGKDCVIKIHGQTYSKTEKWSDHFNDTFTRDEYDEFIKKFLRESFSLLKPGGSIVSFIDDKYSGVLIRLAEDINLEEAEKDKRAPRGFVHKRNIHFVKVNSIPKINVRTYATAVEVAVWMVKPRYKGPSKNKPEVFNYENPKKGRRLFDSDGKEVGIDIRSYHNQRWSNVYFYNIGSNKRTGHPCEKYDGMIRPLILTHSNPGSIVLDPFFGGCNTGFVCQELERDYIGFEINKDWFNKATKLLGVDDGPCCEMPCGEQPQSRSEEIYDSGDCLQIN